LLNISKSSVAKHPLPPILPTTMGVKTIKKLKLETLFRSFGAYI